MEKGNGTLVVEDVRKYIRRAMQSVKVESDADKIAILDLEAALYALSFHQDNIAHVSELPDVSKILADTNEQQRRLRQISKETGRYNGGVGTGLETALPPGYED